MFDIYNVDEDEMNLETMRGVDADGRDIMETEG